MNGWTKRGMAIHGILFNQEKEWRTGTWNRVDEPPKHYAKLKKPDIRGHISYDSTFMKNSQQAYTHRQKAYLCLPRDRVGKKWQVTA